MSLACSHRLGRWSSEAARNLAFWRGKRYLRPFSGGSTNGSVRAASSTSWRTPGKRSLRSLSRSNAANPISAGMPNPPRRQAATSSTKSDPSRIPPNPPRSAERAIWPQNAGLNTSSIRPTGTPGIISDSAACWPGIALLLISIAEIRRIPLYIACVFMVSNSLIPAVFRNERPVRAAQIPSWPAATVPSVSALPLSAIQIRASTDAIHCSENIDGWQMLGPPSSFPPIAPSC